MYRTIALITAGVYYSLPLSDAINRAWAQAITEIDLEDQTGTKARKQEVWERRDKVYQQLERERICRKCTRHRHGDGISIKQRIMELV